jgi:hypothetical protein
MMTATTVMPNLTPAPRLSLMDGLVDTLRSERRLLDELRGIMDRQRAAIAANDLQALDDSTFDMQRVLLTLGEARKRRRTIAERLGCDPDSAPRTLAEALDTTRTGALGISCRDLEESARSLTRDVAVNRQVLQQGLAAGEQFIRMIAAPLPPSAGYDRPNATPPSGARLVNRQA